MAILDIDIQHLSANKFFTDIAKTYVEIRDGELAAKTGIIQLGVIPVMQAANAGTLAQHNANNATSDLSSFKTLQGLISGLFTTATTTYTGVPPPLGEQEIERYYRAAGIMDGVSSNGSTTTAAVRARKTGTSGEVMKVRVEIYHRTTGGVETLLDSFTTPDLTEGVYVNYTGDVTINQVWGTDERLAMRCIGINLGEPT